MILTLLQLPPAHMETFRAGSRADPKSLTGDAQARRGAMWKLATEELVGHIRAGRLRLAT